jgi:hypothetical protein
MNHLFEFVSDLPPSAIWPVLADIAKWPEVDHNIQEIKLLDNPAEGARFYLKPKGGPRLNFTVGKFNAPSHYTDVCHLFLAKMHTAHELIAHKNGTKIRVLITIEGPLKAFWWFAAGRKHANGLPAQTEGIIQRARENIS